ncbi:acetyl-CoA hydrolase/transferase family protein [Clostridium sp. AWRP]|uniref:acetyl-CoA hydrolase/transferase family protein n=1 Tax=Clostridium sp. AWRP TaxID=2212991 RepID=UPI000FDAA1B1|nr:acetyl-CoA hydrolase/transferase family protein [Clostridium sp. AWRP]AZV55627.1 succinate CoA transferase [Clostridium sp. AWRP]
MITDRIRDKKLLKYVGTANEAAQFIKDGMTVGTSGFTFSGYPKVVPIALANRVKEGAQIKINLFTGASVGDELDGELARAGAINRRFPYQTHKDIRNAANSGEISYVDAHLSMAPQFVDYGFMGKIDVAIVEAVGITEEGYIIPTTSVGNTATYVRNADIVIVEINESQPISLLGTHDIYIPEKPPLRQAIPITHVGDRIGTDYIVSDPKKIKCIVFSDIKDNARKVAPINDVSRKMAENLMDFLNNEVRHERLPEDLLPLQSGVGSVSNAVLAGLEKSKFNNLQIFTEVAQDSVFNLMDEGKISVASATAISLSEEGQKKFYRKIDEYRKKIILRPQEISNNPELVRRLGVIAMNTAIEADIYGNVNSSQILGSKMMNGIGGSGDFTRSAYISIFTTESVAKNGEISSIVPMVPHCDHSEHDVDVIVTEQGVADLRGLSPKERAKVIIENCSNPCYRPMLKDYFKRACQGKNIHTPMLLNEALSWHQRYKETGSMKIKAGKCEGRDQLNV